MFTFPLMPSDTDFTKCFISLYSDQDNGNVGAYPNIYQGTKKWFVLVPCINLILGLWLFVFFGFVL